MKISEKQLQYLILILKDTLEPEVGPPGTRLNICRDTRIKLLDEILKQQSEKLKDIEE